MKELALKYGCNPNQKPSRIYMADGSELPIEVISGRPVLNPRTPFIKQLWAAIYGFSFINIIKKRDRTSGGYFF